MNQVLARPRPFALGACLFYEALTVVAVIIVGLLLPHAILGMAAGLVASARLLVTHLILLLLIYFAWQWMNGGQTLAMKTWKIILVTENGSPIRPAQAVFRFAIAFLGFVFGGIGFLWALIDRDHCYLHDRVAGTRLINMASER